MGKCCDVYDEYNLGNVIKLFYAGAALDRS